MAGLDLNAFLNSFIIIVTTTLHDIVMFLSEALPIVIPVFVGLMFIVLISGTVLTIMYIITAGLKPRW
jgi:hypothetical protein